MKTIAKASIIASISIASMSVSTNEHNQEHTKLKLNNDSSESQNLLTVDEVTPLLSACTKKVCPHGEVPHSIRPFWEQFLDFFSFDEVETGAMLARDQSGKSSDDDFA